jgi:hypothetical protein
MYVMMMNYIERRRKRDSKIIIERENWTFFQTTTTLNAAKDI